MKQASSKNKINKWTLEKCRSISRKFESEAVWASCKSSSYKAAVARGFLQACLEAQSVDRLQKTRSELREGVKLL